LILLKYFLNFCLPIVSGRYAGVFGIRPNENIAAFLARKTSDLYNSTGSLPYFFDKITPPNSRFYHKTSLKLPVLPFANEDLIEHFSLTQDERYLLYQWRKDANSIFRH